MQTNTLIIIVFYLSIFFLIFLKRKKFDFQKVGNVPIIAILRTKLGIKVIDKVGTKFKKPLKIIGYIGIVIGILGLIAIFGMIAYSFFMTIFVPEAPSAVSPVIPGVKIPGAQIFVPFWYGIIALFIVVVFHEFGHGIIAKAHNLKIKNTGFALFLILPGAFVEPDEKKLIKSKAKVQQSVYAAGPWFNIILAFIALLVLGFLFIPATDHFSNPEGFKFSQVGENTPAQFAELPTNTVFVEVNNISTKSVYELGMVLSDTRPNQTINMKTIDNEEFSVTLTQHPQTSDQNMSYIGILGLSDYNSSENFFQAIMFHFFNILSNLFFWVYVLSLGIGLANLLPLGPLDGGRMFFNALKSFKIKEKTAKLISAKISILTLIFLLISLIIPIVRAVI
jgi:membrane-associated protease RseP (regulator of RpoE activity)